MKRWIWIVAVLIVASSRPAVASTRLAVLIMADDAALSNNLTEVAIASLADKPGYELLGLRELEIRLTEIAMVRTDGLRACLVSPSCLTELGALVGVERAVIGAIRRDNQGFQLDFSLVDVTTARAEARLSRESSSELEALISAVQSGVFELVPAAPTAREATLAPPVESPPSKAQAARRASEKNPPKNDEKSRESALPYIAFGTAALAVVAFSAAVVTGTIGAARPEGDSRDEIQKDLARRQGYASLANGLFVTGGVLASISVVTFVVPWD
jgi:hypothetical protein